MKRKLNKKRLCMFLIFILFLVIFAISGLKIIIYLKANHNNKKIQETINKKIKLDDKQKIKYDIDFKSLKKQNSDTVAYLKVNGTNINYIVVRTNDNSYYLKHNFNKDWNVSGWIFADYHNKFDGTDNNIVIFGHNTRDGSMFGTLKNVLTENWQKNEENLKIILVTEKNTYYYQVFSTYEIIPEDYYIKTQFKDIDDFGKLIEEVKKRSNYNYNEEVKPSDKILTLSSCTSNGKKRVVLHAKLIENE